MAHLAEPLMTKGGFLFTMTYYGSQMVVENYNILAHDAARLITGETLYIDGGYHIMD
jgi:enoyl-[acyl-carrier protein] reductase I